jgi:hypothetical protein
MGDIYKIWVQEHSETILFSTELHWSKDETKYSNNKGNLPNGMLISEPFTINEFFVVNNYTCVYDRNAQLYICNFVHCYC